MSDIDPQHIRIIEAYIFASPEPVSERALQGRLPEGTDLSALLNELQSHYAARGVNLIRAGKSWAFRTAEDVSSLLNKEIEVGRAPSRAAIETLAICAYHQPVTRAEIEEIRGVSLSKGPMDVLLEVDWIRRGRCRHVSRTSAYLGCDRGVCVPFRNREPEGPARHSGTQSSRSDRSAASGQYIRSFG